MVWEKAMRAEFLKKYFRIKNRSGTKPISRIKLKKI